MGEEYLRRIKKFVRIVFYDQKIKEAEIILISASYKIKLRNYVRVMLVQKELVLFLYVRL